MVRFLHTSDWQLGMARHFFSDGAQERFAQARFDSIRTMGRIAVEEKCQFMVVCGDVFESNQVDRKTVARAMEALREVQVPVYILPGNHDPLNEASVYRSGTFMERNPGHVRVVEDAAPFAAGDGVELVGAPWMSKRPAANPVEDALAAPGPAAGVVRICIGHGAIDILSPDPDAAGTIRLTALERAIAKEKVHFVALGDRHSLTRVGSGERVWYSGTPEATDFSEGDAGRALVVEIDGGRVSARGVQVGHWRFSERRVDLNSADDVEALRQWLEDREDKERTVVRLRLVGSLSLSRHALLQGHLAAAQDLFAALDVREEDLLAVPDETDFDDLGFSGFVQSALERLRQELSQEGSGSAVARDALMLLLRLSREAA